MQLFTGIERNAKYTLKYKFIIKYEKKEMLIYCNITKMLKYIKSKLTLNTDL